MLEDELELREVERVEGRDIMEPALQSTLTTVPQQRGNNPMESLMERVARVAASHHRERMYAESSRRKETDTINSMLAIGSRFLDAYAQRQAAQAAQAAAQQAEAARCRRHQLQEYEQTPPEQEHEQTPEETWHANSGPLPCPLLEEPFRQFFRKDNQKNRKRRYRQKLRSERQEQRAAAAATTQATRKDTKAKVTEGTASSSRCRSRGRSRGRSRSRHSQVDRDPPASASRGRDRTASAASASHGSDHVENRHRDDRQCHRDRHRDDRQCHRDRHADKDNWARMFGPKSCHKACPKLGLGHNPPPP